MFEFGPTVHAVQLARPYVKTVNISTPSNQEYPVEDLHKQL